jgi:hypothetical protein
MFVMDYPKPRRMLKLLQFNLPFKTIIPIKWTKGYCTWMVKASPITKTFDMANTTWAHYEEIKSDILAINSMSSQQT